MVQVQIGENPFHIGTFSRTIVPNQWQGETDCIIGPFSDQQVVQHYFNAVVDFGHYELFRYQVFAKGDSWYAQITST